MSQIQKIADFVSVNHKHIFSQEEREEQAHLLAQAVKNKSIKEVEKKSAMNQYKDEIDKLDKDIKIASNHVNDGYTFKDFPCELHLNYATKKRMYIEKNTGDVIKEEDFHNSDYQKKLDFEAEQQRIFNEQIDENNDAVSKAEKPSGKLKKVKEEEFGDDFEEFPGGDDLPI
jgi:hypothetical protein